MYRRKDCIWLSLLPNDDGNVFYTNQKQWEVTGHQNSFPQNVFKYFGLSLQ
jgi:hypothetical protein